MENYQPVHKILYWDRKRLLTIAFVKFVNKDDMKEIRTFVGIINRYIEDVSLKDLEVIKDTGVEIYSDSLHMFLTKDDYEDLDLLTDDELGIAVQLK